MMEAQFEAMEGRLEEWTVATAQPEIIADVPKWQGMLKEMAQLEPAVNAWRQYRQLLSEIEQAREMRADPDMGDMAEEELKELLPREEEERQRLRLFLIPHDPNDDRSVVMEIRPGAGGEEAALFAGADGLDFYRRIASEAPEHLKPGGRLCLEIGDGQGDAVKALLREGFTDIQVLNDLNGLPRVVSAKIKEENRS